MRYSRHIILPEIGQAGQDKISAAKVLVIGAGGLGCPVLQYLTAAGVGTIGIIDFDIVELSNLQRQVLFGTSSLGENKAIAAKKRLEDLNSAISINAYPEQLCYQNAIDLFQKYDIIVDGSDNFKTRYLVNDACIIANKPLVFAAIYKFEGQVSVFNHSNGPTYRCLFPSVPQEETMSNCSDIGVLGVLPGIIGSMQANEVLKLVLNLGNILSGELLCYNALNMSTSIIKIIRNDSFIQSVMDNQFKFNKKQLNINCKSEGISLSIEDITLSNAIQFIDVRELHEVPKVAHTNVISIPLNEIEDHLNSINNVKTKMIFCQSGIRSKKAAKILKELGVENCFSLHESAREINEFLKIKYKRLTHDQ